MTKEERKIYNKEYRQKHKAQTKKYYREHKVQIKAQAKKYYQDHKEELKKYQKEYKQKNKTQIKAQRKKYRQDHKEEIKKYYQEHKAEIKEYYQKHKAKIKAQRKKYYQEHSWYKTYSRIKARCENKKHLSYKYYGAKGIKNLLTIEDLKFLWFRDKAYEMKKPSIDRIDNDGNYEISNCRYIEMSENHKRRKVQKMNIGEHCLIKVPDKGVIEARVLRIDDLELIKKDTLVLIDAEGNEYIRKYWEVQKLDKEKLKKIDTTDLENLGTETLND